MPDAVTHPTAQELAAFGLGKVPERAAAAIAGHLAACPACRQAVAGLPANLPPELAQHPKFRIVRELGRGGMGVIYLAEHRVMEKSVALKVISPAVLDNPNALARFHAEAKAAGRLDHQNIARAYDADQAGPLHFLVMEFVEGISLAQLLEQQGPLPVATACHYIRQAALGLQHAFEADMVHRDVKPQNLMLTPKGLVKVLDFGLARLRSERAPGGGLTQDGAFMGTPDYVAPEQATDARQADTRADIYSLGCTLYALLTGRPPFREDTVVKLVLAHLEKAARPLHEVRPDVPRELSAVVARMLAKDPAHRYQRPLEVVQALAPFGKAGGKPGAGGAALPAGESSPGLGAGDTRRLQGPGKGPPPLPARTVAVPAGADKGAPFRDLTSAAAPPKKGRAAPGRSPAAGRKRAGLLAAMGAAVLALAVGAWLQVAVVQRQVPGRVEAGEGEAFVMLDVNQPGAEVLIDGQKTTVNVPGDNKPVKIKVAPGRHQLRISKEGFEAVTREVELKTGKSAPIRVQLEPVKTGVGEALLVLEVDQPGAEVFVDGVKTTVIVPGDNKLVEIKAEPGRHALRISKAGFETVTREIELKPGKSAVIRVQLEQVKTAPAREIINSIGMKLVLIPRGRFWMGSPPDEKDRNTDEEQHEVDISRPFYLGIHEVTQGEYQQVMGINPSWFSPAGRERAKVKDFTAAQLQRLPVENVSWEDARQFCDRLRAKERASGLVYRLPTEAEWEYACRGGAPFQQNTEPFYPFGRSLFPEQANFSRNPAFGRTATVGSYEKNGFGLFDMHGNVWEWCADWHGPYGADKATDPTGPANGASRVQRGGAWLDPGRFCRAAFRNSFAPGGRSFSVGFRVAASVPPGSR